MLIRYVTLWPWPLTHWPWKFVVYQESRDQSLYKMWAKSNNKRVNYWRFSMFSRAILGGGESQLTELSLQGWVDPTSPNLGNHRTIIAVLHFCFRIRISCCVFKRSKLSDVLNDAKSCNSPPLWKLGEGWSRSLYELLKPYLRPNLRNTFDIRPLRGCWLLSTVD